jgi:hypothetical protein
LPASDRRVAQARWRRLSDISSSATGPPPAAHPARPGATDAGPPRRPPPAGAGGLGGPSLCIRHAQHRLLCQVAVGGAEVAVSHLPERPLAVGMSCATGARSKRTAVA